MRPSGLLHAADNNPETPDVIASVNVSTAVVSQAYPAGAAVMCVTPSVACYASWNSTTVSSGAGSTTGSSGNAVYLLPNVPRWYQINTQDATGNYSIQGATASVVGYVSLEFWRR